jgi:hypothetical protein
MQKINKNHITSNKIPASIRNALSAPILAQYLSTMTTKLKVSPYENYHPQYFPYTLAFLYLNISSNDLIACC